MNLPTLPDSATILTEMKTATGWPNITVSNDGTYILEFGLTDVPVIKGLRQGRNNFILDFESFNGLPISFLVTIGTATHQYWTLNGQQHRANDKPAYVGVDPAENRYIQRWFWNGVAHRPRGPAKILMSGVGTSDVEGFRGYRMMTWEMAAYEWWREGFQCKYPDPSSALVSKGQTIINRETGRVDSPRGDLAAFSCQGAEFEWGYTEHQKKVLEDAFLPNKGEVVELSETYADGEMTGRSCFMVDFSWWRNGRLIADGLTKFHEEIKTNLIADLGLWDGPFYGKEDTEFLVLAEYERVGPDDEPQA